MRQRITLPGGIDVRQQAGPTRSRPRDRSPADGHRADQGLERPGRCGSDHVDVRQRVPLHTHVVEREDDLTGAGHPHVRGVRSSARQHETSLGAVRRFGAPLPCTATHLLGSAAPGPRSWLWAWANPSGYPPATVALSERVRAFGTSHGIAEFANPEIPFDALPGAPGDALRVVSQMVDAVKSATGQWTGYQLSAGGGTYAGFIIEHPPFLLPPPEGPRVSRVLMQGLKELTLWDDRRALHAYAAHRGLGCSDDGSQLVLTGPGFSATAKFASAQRVVDLSFSIGQ